MTNKMKEEFRGIGFGNKSISIFSEEAKSYLLDRHHRGIEDLKQRGEYPSRTGDNGYTPLLGIWRFTKSKGIDCAVGKKHIWMATILNNDLI